jgi:uncharacterized protein
MPPRLPQIIEPARLADEAETIAGKLSIDGMQRLQALVNEPEAEVQFRLSFARDERGFIIISGEYTTVLTLRCQRCLEPLHVSLEKAIRIGWVTGADDIKFLPADLEPMLVQEPRVALKDLIEEEILLGLPMAPVHAERECPATNLMQALKEKKDNPFAVLKDMKLNKD